MDLPISFIGLSHSIFAVIVILIKRPLKIADVILSILLFVFTLTFGFDVLQAYGILPNNRWVVSMSLFMLFAPLIYLYSKNVTNNFDKFNPIHYLHALPPLLLVSLYLLFRLLYSEAEGLEVNLNANLLWLRNGFGYVFNLLFIIYAYFALKNVVRFKRQIKEVYSYKSDKISLNWLLFVIVSFILTFAANTIFSTLFEFQKIENVVEVDMYRHMVQLFFVYVISIWGFRQTQLNTEQKKIIPINQGTKSEELTIGKYQKSGLTAELAEDYLKELIDYMNNTEAWKDNELSIAKLSTQTNIPKHHITQVLNERLGKNFYLFVNEYRIEYAKKLLITEKYDAWSILAIAYECGFNSKATFNNIFKKYTNLTPSEYKKQRQSLN